MGTQKVRIDDYLLAIDRICGQSESVLARTGQIAKLLGLADGTASSTLKDLAETGLIELKPYEGSKLTELGRVRLRVTYERLRLIKTWLSTLLQLEDASLTDEAIRLESSASDALINALRTVFERSNSDPSNPPDSPSEDAAGKSA